MAQFKVDTWREPEGHLDYLPSTANYKLHQYTIIKHISSTHQLDQMDSIFGSTGQHSYGHGRFIYRAANESLAKFSQSPWDSIILRDGRLKNLC